MRAMAGAGARTPRDAAPLATVTPTLRLVDGFELSVAGHRHELPLPAQRLLAFLALHDQPLLRRYVAGTLWLDSSDERAAGSLRSAIWRVRQVDLPLVEAASSRLRLAPEVAVDVRSVVSWAHRVLDPAAELREGDIAPVWSPCELLPDWYDDWVEVERERLHALRTHALEALCRRLTAVGRFGEAVEAGLAAVRDEPFRESAHRALICVHLAEGNRAAALEQYRSYVRRLQCELDMRPSTRIQRLVGAITTQ